MKKNEYLNKIFCEFWEISIRWIPEITDLTKKELTVIIHYLWNYLTPYTLDPNFIKNPDLQKKLYKKLKEFKKLIEENKEIRQKLAELFYKHNVLDSHKAFKEIWFDFEIKLN